MTHKLPDGDRIELARAIYDLKDRLQEQQDQFRSASYVDLDTSKSDNPTPREQELLDTLETMQDELDTLIESTIDRVTETAETLFSSFQAGEQDKVWAVVENGFGFTSPEEAHRFTQETGYGDVVEVRVFGRASKAVDVWDSGN